MSDHYAQSLLDALRAENEKLRARLRELGSGTVSDAPNRQRLRDYVTELRETVRGGGTFFAPRNAAAFADALEALLEAPLSGSGERADAHPKLTITPEWCVEAFYRVNPGAHDTLPRGIPSLYLLDFAREVLDAAREGELLGIVEHVERILREGAYGVPADSEAASHLHGVIDRALRAIPDGAIDASRAGTEARTDG